MPSLEHLKKQAKLFVRWHRAGHIPVAAQIRSLPRFERLSDQEILAREFRLADAQELVARRTGWENWLALLKDFASMPMAPPAPTASDADIVTAESQLLVSDIPASMAFYAGKLGFRTKFSYGEPAFYAQVARGGGRLNLRRVLGPIYADGLREREPDLLAATLAVTDAKPLFLEFQSAGVEFHQALRTEPWGSRTFIVRDPDGNLICFAGGEA